MAVVGVRELKAKASEIVERSSKGETFLITKRGRPVSVIMPFDGALEDLILAEAPRFVRLREKGRRELAAGHTIPLSRLKRELAGSGQVRARRGR